MPLLKDAVEHLRLYILHDTGGTGVDWETDDRTCRHSNKELTAHLNSSVEEVIKRVRNHWSTVEADVEAPSVVQPVANVVTLPQYRLDRVSTHLIKIDATSGDPIGSPLCIDDLYRENSDWSLARMGTALAWTIIGDQAIVHGLKPNTTYRFMQSWVTYPTKLQWPQDKAEELTIDSSYTHVLPFYASYLAFMKDDPDVLDLGRSEEFLVKFEREVGRDDNMYVKRRRNRRDRYQVTDYWG